VSADPEDDTETPGTAPQPAALLSGTAPSEEASTEAVGASGSTETDPAEPETVSVTAAAPDTALVAKDSEGNPLPESLDEGIQPASAQPTPAATKKAKTSWLRSCWPKAKKTAVVVKKNLQEAFVDIAPYLEDGLKLVAASSPNPAIQSVINFSAILIREASSAMTQDGATFDLTTKNGRKVTVASPPLLHAHNFSNNGNLSEESKMVISIILHRTAPVLNYEDLIGFINMVVAQDNDSPETIRFDPISGNISLYPNNMATQPVLLSVPILESIKNPADRETTSHILLEYVAATEDRALAEKVLRSRLGSNFLPTPASWVRSTFQQLVERNSPFVLDRTLSIEGKIDLSIREAVSEREAQLKISEPETIVRVPLARKS
jgi:hypothetical protein